MRVIYGGGNYMYVLLSSSGGGVLLIVGTIIRVILYGCMGVEGFFYSRFPDKTQGSPIAI